jgi:hypothetical protein
MALGGYNESYHIGEQITYIPMKTTSGYHINLKKVFVGNTEVNISSTREGLVDSGTTFTIFPLKLYT